MRPLRGLRAQVTVALALLVAVVMAATGVVIVQRIDRQDRARVDAQLRVRATKVRTDATKPQDGKADDERNRVDPAAKDGDAGLLAGTDALTRVLSGSSVVTQRGEAAVDAGPPPTRDGFSTVTIDGQPWRSLTQAIPGVRDGRLQVLQSLDPVRQRVAESRRLIALVTGLATLVAALGVWLMTGLLLRPLERLRLGARALRPGDPAGTRLPAVDRPREIAELSRTLNEMLDRLAQSTTATRRFTADAGHELRTPLAGLGMDLETLGRHPGLSAEDRAEIVAAMTAEHARVVALLDGLQRLARGDAEAVPDHEQLDLGVLVDDAVAGARRRHPAVTFATRPTTDGGELTLLGWPEGLRLAVDNLLDNAALHGRRDGAVEVAVGVSGGRARVTVDDDGPGIPSDRRDVVRERFARGEAPRSPGSGLGLALVDQQARLHHGALRLEDAPAGGLRAILEFAVR
ncbi:HAMP domain-containing sensor histidine kinase [Patulibacter sp. NPDC049589]|uniref:sensor histidine kinase n=1 Tax=Patulibacter sp. NPDC049589 TaxID=3154731 RepID=UPI0034220B3D